MSFNYAITTAQEILHKPIEIKNVVVGVKELKTKGIITQATANAVINLIFTDITSVVVDSASFIAAAEAVQQSVHNYSGYLYKTTDELTAEMSSGPSLTDVTHVNTVRGVLNDVFDIRISIFPSNYFHCFWLNCLYLLNVCVQRLVQRSPMC